MEFIQYPRRYGKLTMLAMLENEVKKQIAKSERMPLSITIEIDGKLFRVISSAVYWNAES